MACRGQNSWHRKARTGGCTGLEHTTTCEMKSGHINPPIEYCPAARASPQATHRTPFQGAIIMSRD
ncbi:hypothetical protein AIOL_001599 [Candidatus Rhodobacter oscarellae]|uniref:Uncharacterized protein n=1 Tax=Candidatus Rhodobacter oscarellae TaxID=1675527 RepID=A0A0J9E1Q5_9RHOB|nr:hypothetical protein AIOL_001599 [Candidatus Rhodobacter lobularis]